MKIATILFYVSPSIETHIKNAKTIDLMEGGNEQAQNVPNSEINPCDGDRKEGHADGSSRDVPIQTDSEGAKKTVDICVDGEEGKADGSSDENDKKDDEEEGESGKVESSSGEESTSTDSLVSSSYSSDSSSSGSSSIPSPAVSGPQLRSDSNATQSKPPAKSRSTGSSSDSSDSS